MTQRRERRRILLDARIGRGSYQKDGKPFRRVYIVKSIPAWTNTGGRRSWLNAMILTLLSARAQRVIINSYLTSQMHGIDHLHNIIVSPLDVTAATYM